MENEYQKEMENEYSEILLGMGKFLHIIINKLVDEHEILARPIAKILCCYVCCMVIERFGESEEAHDELNELMREAWKRAVKNKKNLDKN